MLSEGMPRLIYVKTPAPDREEKLAEMLARIANADVSYRKFSDAAELERLVLDDLAVLLTERFQTGRTPEPEHQKPAGLKTHVPVSTNRLVGRATEIAEIEELLTGDRRGWSP